MNQQERYNPDELSIAALLRMAADGELDERQDAVLHAHLEVHPEDQQRVEFEQHLREACRCACTPDCCAPDSLRQRVQDCCCEADLTDRLGARAEQTRDRSFWAGRVIARFGAVAALIALVAVVAFMVGRTGLMSVGGRGVLEPSVMVEQVSQFVREEHNRCAETPPGVDPKFNISRVEDLPAEFASLMGKSVSLMSVIEAEQRGLRFVDAGTCRLPNMGVAMHIRFQSEEPDGGLVSVWAQIDDGALPLEDRITYTSGEGCDCVRFWRVDGVLYVMVCPNLGAAPAAGKAFDCPNQSKSFGPP